jgi:hypothetical protein
METKMIDTNKLQITPQTIVADLLNAYPELEDKLIEIASVFKKLKNPVLRKTIAKVTSLKQAAVIGNVALPTLINELRKTVGQETLITDNEKNNANTVKPGWVKEEKIKLTYDAREDLENGVHPVSKVVKDIETLTDNELYLLITPFIPLPLIDIVNKKGFAAHSEKSEENKFSTFIKRM